MQDNQRQTLWAYVAGILDADGCFLIMKNNNMSNRRKNISFTPGVKISMIEKEAVEMITNELGYGQYKLEGARRDRPNSKPIYHWHLRSKRNVPEFLIQVIPYLRVKKNRAEFLLEFCNTMENCPVPYYGLSQNELNYREKSYWKMRELNGSKVAATTKS